MDTIPSYINIQKYDLAHIDRVLARAYNVSFRSLNKNGWNRFCDIWKEKYPEDLKEFKTLIEKEKVFPTPPTKNSTKILLRRSQKRISKNC